MENQKILKMQYYTKIALYKLNLEKENLEKEKLKQEYINAELLAELESIQFKFNRLKRQYHTNKHNASL